MRCDRVFAIVIAIVCIGIAAFFVYNGDNSPVDNLTEVIPLSESDILDNSQIDFHSVIFERGEKRSDEDLTEAEKQQIWSFIEQLTFEKTYYKETYYYNYETGLGGPAAIIFIPRDTDAVLIHIRSNSNIELIYRHLNKVQLDEDLSNAIAWMDEEKTIVFHADRYTSDIEAFYEVLAIVGLYPKDLRGYIS